MSTTPFIAILMGSDSDLPTLAVTFETLRALDVPFEARVLSAHRTPEETLNFVKEATTRGCAVFIAAAGLAAHLAGAVAANTIRPVIGIPIGAGELKGLDALLATVQMPGGTPVACTTIGKAGAKNAAVLAAEILALQDKALEGRLLTMREQKRNQLKAADEKLQKELCNPKSDL